MKRIILLLAAAVLFVACPAPDGNRQANTNTNENNAEPAAAAPAPEAFLALDKQATEAYFKGDSKFFDGFLSDKFVIFERGRRMDKAATVKMIADVKCDVKEGWKLEDPQMSKIDADTYAFSYKGTFDGSCTGPAGESMKVPSPVRAATVYVRDGDKWRAAFHGENPIIDPANPPAPEGEKKEPAKDTAAKDEAAKDEPAAPKSDEAKETAKPAAGDENTAALVKIHTSGWEAFKAKDAKKFEEITSENLAIVDPLGKWISGREAVIKQWTETMKCEGITKVEVTDGVATALSPTVELLTLKGTADGTCDGQKNGDLYQTAVYVKEGDAWKLAFMFESPAM